MPTPPPVAMPAPAAQHIQAKARPHSPPRPQPVDTSTTSMRGDIDRCWANGAIHVAIDFDAAGASTKVAVSGGDAAVASCVQSAAKKWKSLGRKHIDLGFTKN
jgi:hypothetical protein